MSSSPSQICRVGPSTWTSSTRPARCLPQLICCQVTEMTPFEATRREIQPSPERSVSAAEMSGGRPALVPVNRPGRRGHGERRVRPLGVVALHPPVELALGRFQIGEHPPQQELLAKGPVEPLDLAGGGGAPGSGQQMVDPVLPADPIEQDLDVFDPEPTGEHLSVIGQDLLGYPVAAHGLGEVGAHRAAGGPEHDSLSTPRTGSGRRCR